MPRREVKANKAKRKDPPIINIDIYNQNIKHPLFNFIKQYIYKLLKSVIFLVQFRKIENIEKKIKIKKINLNWN